ncbi:hypothetical protein BOTBODRAFT_149784 [Botryobasidium botryosum FD-172 SS1]|uniref:Uncharacterized protein n=1 Tax=Botryobasidium botryosum (strain FD-172 SS1) TaxID=930990 RepID=A0A067M3I5_BOTB1|nr:hypothetical protein BOTBODRAFT_149784 [Botryobasidium botryosum FD-172 SS1]
MAPINLRKRKQRQEPQEATASLDESESKKIKKVHWPEDVSGGPGKSAVKSSGITLKISRRKEPQVRPQALTDTDEAALTVEELQELVRQEQVLGTAKRRGPKTARVLQSFTNARIVHLEGLISLRTSSSASTAAPPQPASPRVATLAIDIPATQASDPVPNIASNSAVAASSASSDSSGSTTQLISSSSTVSKSQPAAAVSNPGPSATTASPTPSNVSVPTAGIVSGSAAISKSYPLASGPGPSAIPAKPVSGPSSTSGQDSVERDAFGPFQLHSPSPEPFQLVSSAEGLELDDLDDNLEPTSQEKKERGASRENPKRPAFGDSSYLPGSPQESMFTRTQRTLIGWAAFAPHPGQGEVKKLTVAHLQTIARKILEDESGKTSDHEKIQYIPWTDEQKNMSPSSPMYKKIPLVIDQNGRVLRTVDGPVDLQQPEASEVSLDTKAAEPEDVPKSRKGKERETAPVSEPPTKGPKVSKSNKKVSARQTTKKAPVRMPDTLSDTDTESEGDERISLPSSASDVSGTNPANTLDRDHKPSDPPPSSRPRPRPRRAATSTINPEDARSSFQYGGGSYGGDYDFKEDFDGTPYSHSLHGGRPEVVARAQSQQPTDSAPSTGGRAIQAGRAAQPAGQFPYSAHPFGAAQPVPRAPLIDPYRHQLEHPSIWPQPSPNPRNRHLGTEATTNTQAQAFGGATARRENERPYFDQTATLSNAWRSNGGGEGPSAEGYHSRQRFDNVDYTRQTGRHGGPYW